MNFTSRCFSIAGMALLVVTLTSCADIAQQHKEHHAQAQAAPQNQMGPQGGAGHMGMMGADMGAMCGMHEKMMSASPEERRTLMQEHMKSMSPEMMQKQMAIMQEEMQMMRERMGSQPAAK